MVYTVSIFRKNFQWPFCDSDILPVCDDDVSYLHYDGVASPSVYMAMGQSSQWAAARYYTYHDFIC